MKIIFVFLTLFSSPCWAYQIGSPFTITMQGEVQNMGSAEIHEENGLLVNGSPVDEEECQVVEMQDGILLNCWFNIEGEIE